MAITKVTEKKEKKKVDYDEVDDRIDIDDEGKLKEMSETTKRKRKNSKTGKKFEDELKALMNHVFSYVRRVHDTRAFQGANKMHIAPKVHCDFEGIMWEIRSEEHHAKDIHAYIEAKSSKKHPSFPFWSSIVENGGRSKEHQWGWMREVATKANSEVGFYAINNRHTPMGFYIVLMSWDDTQHWMKWLSDKGKRSVPWDKIMIRATFDNILFQKDDDDSPERFVTDENIKKMRTFMMRQLQVKSLPTKIAEVDYEW